VSGASSSSLKPIARADSSPLSYPRCRRAAVSCLSCKTPKLYVTGLVPALATCTARNRPPAPLRSRAAGPSPARNPPRSRRSARHAARQAPGIAQARVPEALARCGPPQPAHAQPCRTWTPVSLQGAEGELEERASAPLAVLKRAGALCQQALRSSAACACTQPPQSQARSGQPRGVVGALWWGGGWRRWSHRAEERWARRWSRICEAAVRARREQGRGWVPHLVGRGGDRSGGECGSRIRVERGGARRHCRCSTEGGCASKGCGRGMSSRDEGDGMSACVG